jgi:excisionase family DNA binding protein
MSESVQGKRADFTILTVREVAEYLRMSEAKVYRLANERQLPAIRIGKAWRFRKDLLDEWLSKCTESDLKAESQEPQADIRLAGTANRSEMG